MRVLVTGAAGFIAKNLIVRLNEIADLQVLTAQSDTTSEQLKNLIHQADFVFHLAGANRPQNEKEFTEINVDLTRLICEEIAKLHKKPLLVYTSSTQAALDNAYGRSKKSAEEVIAALLKHNFLIYRLPNVFGKWSKPNYNSAVATFCYNIIHDLPVTIHDPTAQIRLVYVDDVVNDFISLLKKQSCEGPFAQVNTVYELTVGELHQQLQRFKASRHNLLSEAVGTGLTRALYSTYISFLPKEQFAYSLKKHEDPRGAFVEVLKTKNSGQFSFFTSHPGVVRGNHYHHSKTEKFIVVKGKALFAFRHLITGETYELVCTADKPEIVETVPGWTHNIQNIGQDEMIVMLWANEIFDREHPDTYANEV